VYPFIVPLIVIISLYIGAYKLPAQVRVITQPEYVITGNDTPIGIKEIGLIDNAPQFDLVVGPVRVLVIVYDIGVSVKVTVSDNVEVGVDKNVYVAVRDEYPPIVPENEIMSLVAGAYKLPVQVRVIAQFTYVMVGNVTEPGVVEVAVSDKLTQCTGVVGPVRVLVIVYDIALVVSSSVLS
jgi:hypothetical protein